MQFEMALGPIKKRDKGPLQLLFFFFILENINSSSKYFCESGLITKTEVEINSGEFR
jgi:hypothetical protein